ncbi:MAG: phosphoketolase [Parcubacteria group bacterium CG11_big_fil_rev_8_21_14_0_20_39_22]|nr:MAG: phosphoketolase [Parcubacteria group bacterium CG11_big_fil_rev_8_21_14_0_20_39_22]
MNRHDIDCLKKYVRAANYLVVAQLYLRDNYLLSRPLEKSDIKPRLLGHWGTCPGINFVYAHLNRLISDNDVNMMFVLGPGHGFPALQANLFLEGTLKEFYPEATRNESGIAYISKNFSWPYGFPSHSNPGTPGVILEGGELGYSLSTSYGAVMDNKDLIVACLVGDGEAETGPLATSWHGNKFINPERDGTVLPILHLNGYKISGPTIMGRMSNKELASLFYGYGYEPLIVEGDGDKIYSLMAKSLDLAYEKIKEIKSKKSGTPRFPMIILRTPKGWTGIKDLHGKKIEGNHLSHQIVGKDAATKTEELRAVEDWMRSYKFDELFDPENGFNLDILSILPSENRRMGLNPHAYGGENESNLDLPDTKKFAEDASIPGTIGSSSMRRAGLYLKDVFALNKDKHNFRFFSPDETYSNKLDAIFAETSRVFMLPIEKWDTDLSREGRVVEMLSEHTLQGFSQGYILTGRHAIFTSYEAFITIVASMTDQYAKFLRIARDIPWRKRVPSLNYILTSSGWRQEHNGFSHQNPGFVSTMLEKHGCFIRIFFPADGNSTLEVLKTCLSDRNEIHIIVAGKTLEHRWLTPELAKKELERGLMIWDFASDSEPDIVFSGIGDYMTKECLAAISLLKDEDPSIRVRFVNIVEVTALGIGNEDCRLPFNDFDDYFTDDKPVIFNFYGYPEALKPILLDEKNPERFHVHGYCENGSTTTPFDMHVRNKTSRYHLVIEAAKLLQERGVINNEKEAIIRTKYQNKLSDHRHYIEENGVDPEEIELWKWNRNSHL